MHNTFGGWELTTCNTRQHSANSPLNGKKIKFAGNMYFQIINFHFYPISLIPSGPRICASYFSHWIWLLPSHKAGQKKNFFCLEKSTYSSESELLIKTTFVDYCPAVYFSFLWIYKSVWVGDIEGGSVLVFYCLFWRRTLFLAWWVRTIWNSGAFLGCFFLEKKWFFWT